MKSYIKFNWSFIFELTKLLRQKQWAMNTAKFVHWRTSLANTQIYECYGINWRNGHLLEVGCGQKLAYTLPFAQQNKVTGIDTEPPFHSPYVRSFIDLLRFSGFYRTLKTSANAILGTRRSFKRALSEITGFHDPYNLELVRMNTLQLNFPDNYFDGVFSFSVFEHISEPEKALQEVKRVLKPKGVFYLDIHLYTSIYGDHDPRSNSEKTVVPPWKHIRPSCASLRHESCYLNKVRLAEWRHMLEKTFDLVQFPVIDGEADKCRPYITDEIREELLDYTEEELLTTTVIAVAMKS
ncbi:MAG: class I SAM-dependent methyltransferase [Methylobacter sp.]|jgi:SAM-dependent methyltransferase